MILFLLGKTLKTFTEIFEHKPNIFINKMAREPVNKLISLIQ